MHVLHRVQYKGPSTCLSRINAATHLRCVLSSLLYFTNPYYYYYFYYFFYVLSISVGESRAGRLQCTAANLYLAYQATPRTGGCVCVCMRVCMPCKNASARNYLLCRRQKQFLALRVRRSKGKCSGSLKDIAGNAAVSLVGEKVPSTKKDAGHQYRREIWPRNPAPSCTILIPHTSSPETSCSGEVPSTREKWE